MRRIVVLGIGNPLDGDDAAGICVVHKLQSVLKAIEAGRHRAKPASTPKNTPTIISMEAGTAPENYTSVIRKHRPELLILVDAADMGLPPGALRIIPPEKISALSFSTHNMPLTTFISYVKKFCGNVLLIGVQPEQVGMGKHISKAVAKAVEKLTQAILGGRIAEIPVLE